MGIPRAEGFGFLLLSIFIIQNNEFSKEKKAENLEGISIEMATRLESHLLEQAKIAKTLSSAPIIMDTLLSSNANYSLLSDVYRNQKIENLNEQWENTSDIDDPFIQEHLSNPVSQFLKKQQQLFPEVYGEIFLTNRYGVMIATTGKLTTLAHSHKYWWEASYSDGNGKIFFDDRGFDESVEGYVLGIVVPVKYNNEIIGILKSNVNIIGPLTNIIQDHVIENIQTVQLARTNGVVVLQEGVEPLSTHLNEDFIDFFNQQESGSVTISEENSVQLYAFAPIEITFGSEEYGFGGINESVDHLKGNTGEAWLVVITNDIKASSKSELESFRFIIIFGFLFIGFTVFIAFLFGNWISKPIVNLENLVVQDYLTGLYNRHGFFNLAKHQMKISQRMERRMVLIYADLNGLKEINDSFGHDCGDLAIVGASNIFKETFRTSDIIARFGGDEFVALIVDTSENSIKMFRERFQQVQENYNKHSEFDFQISLSVGFSTYNREAQISLEELIKQADEAMYIEKKIY